MENNIDADYLYEEWLDYQFAKTHPNHNSSGEVKRISKKDKEEKENGKRRRNSK